VRGLHPWSQPATLESSSLGLPRPLAGWLCDCSLNPNGVSPVGWLHYQNPQHLDHWEGSRYLSSSLKILVCFILWFNHTKIFRDELKYREPSQWSRCWGFW
jgi:hypothetical protein